MKKNKILVTIAIILAVVLGGGAAAYIFVDPVQNAVQSIVLKPESYFRKVEEKSTKKSSSALSAAFANISNTMDGDFEYSTNASVKAILGQALKDQMGYQDADSVAINTNMSAKGSLSAQNISVDYNDQTLITLNTTTDIENEIAYIQIPELSDAFISIEADDLMTFLEDNGVYYADAMESTSIDFSLTPDELETMIEKYSSLITSKVSNVERDRGVKGDVNGVDYKYTELTTEISYKDFYNIALEALKEMKKDKVIIRLFTELGGITQEEYKEAFDEAIEDLKTRKDDPSFYGFYGDEDDFDLDDTYFTLITYVNSDMEIMGRVFEYDVDDENIEIGYINAIDGDETGTEMWFKVDDVTYYEMTGTIEEKNGVSNGSYKYTVDLNDGYSEAIEATIEVKDLKTVNEDLGLVSGSMIIQADIEGEKIKLTYDFTVENQKQIIEFKTFINEALYITLIITSEETAVSDIKMPSDEKIYSVVDEASLYTYLEQVDVEGFYSHATNILGEDLINSLFGYDDDYDYDDDDDYDYDYDEDNYFETTATLADFDFNFDGQSFEMPGKVPAAILSKLGVDPTETILADDYLYCPSEDYNLVAYLENFGDIEITAADATLTTLTVYSSDYDLKINGIGIGSTVSEFAQAFELSLADLVDMDAVYIADIADDWDEIKFLISDGKIYGIYVMFNN